MATLDIGYQVVVLDAADLAAVSGFWAGVLSGSVDAEDAWWSGEVHRFTK